MRSPIASATASTIVMKRVPREHARRPMWKPPSPNSVGQRVAEVLVPDHVRETDEREHQPDRHHELHDELLALQVAHDRAVEPDAEQRRDHEHDERHRDQLGHAVVDRQLPVDVREEHADRALREVEDAGGRVHDDEPGRRHRVDAGERQREDQQVDERRRR